MRPHPLLTNRRGRRHVCRDAGCTHAGAVSKGRGGAQGLAFADLHVIADLQFHADVRVAGIRRPLRNAVR
jgi:hypothetical protein